MGIKAVDSQRRPFEQSLGGVPIFLQGCGGNVNPAVGIGYEIDCHDTKERVGIELGAEVTRVAAAIRTNRRARPRLALPRRPPRGPSTAADSV